MSEKEKTYEHIKTVQGFILDFCAKLMERAKHHDDSKLEPPEDEWFEKYTPLLASTTYNSDEYKKFLVELKPALDHHYAKNRHHPEHFPDGIRGMNLIDIVEMYCDWLAATQRHHDGNIQRNISVNQQRFGFSDDVKSILDNTCEAFNK